MGAAHIAAHAQGARGGRAAGSAPAALEMPGTQGPNRNTRGCAVTEEPRLRRSSDGTRREGLRSVTQERTPGCYYE